MRARGLETYPLVCFLNTFFDVSKLCVEHFGLVLDECEPLKFALADVGHGWSG